MSERLSLKVAKVWKETDHILAIRMEAEDGGALPAFTPGAHLDLFLPNGLTPQYSLVNAPEQNDHYLLGVLRERESRGGSAWIHDSLSAGAVLPASQPRNNFPLTDTARRTLLIAGGIGVTPLLSMASVLHARGEDFTFYYCTRSPEETAFRDRIANSGWAERVTYVHDGGDPAQGLDVRGLLATVEEGTHVYCCGPAGLMNAVRDASAHWPSGTVHFEWFSPDAAAAAGGEDRAFTCVLARSGKEVEIPADKTIIEVLSDIGVEVETLCTEGLCGTCLTVVLEGEPDHRDSILTEDEQAANDIMTVCCSRAKGDRLVLDL